MDMVGVVVVLGGVAAVGVEEVCNVDSVEEVKEVKVILVVAVDVALLTVEEVQRCGVDGPEVVDVPAVVDSELALSQAGSATMK